MWARFLHWRKFWHSEACLSKLFFLLNDLASIAWHFHLHLPYATTTSLQKVLTWAASKKLSREIIVIMIWFNVHCWGWTIFYRINTIHSDLRNFWSLRHNSLKYNAPVSTCFMTWVGHQLSFINRWRSLILTSTLSTEQGRPWIFIHQSLHVIHHLPSGFAYKNRS